LTEALLEQGQDVVGVDGFTDFYPRGVKEEISLARASTRLSLIEGPIPTANCGSTPPVEAQASMGRLFAGGFWARR
jgi:hypothetical protein